MRTSRSRRTHSFTCIHCRTSVPMVAYGTAHRNHCPLCLWSRHVDDRIGDRAAGCGGPMAPIAVAADRGEWRLVHHCRACGRLRVNRIAGDDDERALLRLAQAPLEEAPFPLDLVERWA